MTDPVHVSAVDVHAHRRPDALALVAVDAVGGASSWSFRQVEAASRRVAWHLRHSHGVLRGDRVAVVLAQRAESAFVHLACSRVGAIATPLSPMFGPEGLASRLADAAPRLVVTDSARAQVVREALALAGLADVVVRLVDESGFQALLRKGPKLEHTEEVRVGGEEPVWLVYTSGTTGKPKGALLPHRVLKGRMSGFLLAHEPFGADARFWSPADWSWIGGLLDACFAPWHAGVAVVAQERHGAFDAAATVRLIGQQAVTNAFLPPTALKAMARSGVLPRGAPRPLRALHSAGEPLAAPVAAWARETLAGSVCEVYGLTEAAFLVGTSRGEGAPPGAMGRAYPGHLVEVVDGQLCVRAASPTLMLGYWRGPDAAPDLPLDAEGRFLSGDLVEPLGDGFLRYVGRTDDLIKTGGYRVGPAEVEATLLHHPAVAECAVVGVPDPERGARIKAFVKVAPGHAASEALANELMAFVRTRLAAHAHPREVEFVDALPMTVSGKIRRRELRGR